METKQIIAIFAVIAIAVAGIGAAYAYTATLENDSNTADTEYLAISVAGTPAATAYSATFSQGDLRFNTVTTWNQTAGKQSVVYTPTSATSATVEIDGKKAVKLGSTLDLIIDSSLMGNGKLFSFSVSTPESPLSAYGAFVFKYQLGDEIGYVPMDAEAVSGISKEVFFYSDSVANNNSLKLDLYAVELDTLDLTLPEATYLIPEADLSFENITFTFVAEVKEDATTHTLTVNTMNAATQAAAMEVESVQIKDAQGVPYYVKSSSDVTGIYEYTLPAAAYTVEVSKDYNLFTKTGSSDISNGDATATFTAMSVSAVMSAEPTQKTYAKDTQDFIFTGMEVTLTYGSGDDAPTLVVDSMDNLFAMEPNWSSTVGSGQSKNVTIDIGNGQGTPATVQVTGIEITQS